MKLWEFVMVHLHYCVQHKNFQFYPFSCNFHDFIFVNWMKFCILYIPHLLCLFICCWTFWLVLFSGWNKYCCNKHGYSNTSGKIYSDLSIYKGDVKLSQIIVLILVLWESHQLIHAVLINSCEEETKIWVNMWYWLDKAISTTPKSQIHGVANLIVDKSQRNGKSFFSPSMSV